MADEAYDEEGQLEESSRKTKDVWKHKEPEEYAEAIAKFVHFNGKTVNTNTSFVGIRLNPADSKEMPYVSARALMARGVRIGVDYGEGGAVVAGIYKQVTALLHHEDWTVDAAAEERDAITASMEETGRKGYSTGTEHVDARLRQILIPREAAEQGYVSMTPITANGLCEYLFTRADGPMQAHLAAFEEDKKKSEPRLRKIARAQFGIGGANPQNVGGLVRSMQRPLFMDAPRSDRGLMQAFSLYHKGVELDFSRSGMLKTALEAYLDFRRSRGLDADSVAIAKPTNLYSREKEEELIRRIASAVLAVADAVRELLTGHAEQLPQEVNPEDGSPALVSPKLSFVIRALLDEKLRDAAWPRAMAKTISQAVSRATYANKNKMLVLDPKAMATLEGIMEEVFR